MSLLEEGDTHGRRKDFNGRRIVQQIPPTSRRNRGLPLCVRKPLVLPLESTRHRGDICRTTATEARRTRRMSAISGNAVLPFRFERVRQIAQPPPLSSLSFKLKAIGR